MGVVEMYRATGNPRYLELAKNLINIRGMVKNGTDDNQDRIPFRDQKKAMGHAVRANYLYAGAADVYAETGEKILKDNLESIWNDIVSVGGLNTYIPTSSGTVNVLTKYVCNDQSRLERAQKLVDTLGWQMYEDYINNRIVLSPKGYVTYSTPLTVGENVTNVPVWVYELDSMRNDVTIKGAIS